MIQIAAKLLYEICVCTLTNLALNLKHKIVHENHCGTIGRPVATKTRGRIGFWIQTEAICLEHLSTVNNRKDENIQKRGRDWPIFKRCRIFGQNRFHIVLAPVWEWQFKFTKTGARLSMAFNKTFSFPDWSRNRFGCLNISAWLGKGSKSNLNFDEKTLKDAGHQQRAQFDVQPNKVFKKHISDYSVAVSNSL